MLFDKQKNLIGHFLRGQGGIIKYKTFLYEKQMLRHSRLLRYNNFLRDITLFLYELRKP
jgi:predicted membrane metal-binding protein